MVAYLGNKDVYGTPGIVEAGRHKDDSAGPGDTGQAAQGGGGRQFGARYRSCTSVLLLFCYSRLANL